MILREFLYVDTDKVRSMQAQLDGGVAEEERHTEKDDKRTEGGVKGFASHYQGWGTEHYVHKSLGDALFPTLEEALEAEELLRDVSAELQEPSRWNTDVLHKELPPGTIIRVTAPGSLFDARYMASLFAGFASTYSGLQGMGLVVSDADAKTGNKRKPQRSSKVPASEVERTPQLEDSIPDFGVMFDEQGGGISTEFVRSLVRVARGLFTPGLHLNLRPTTDARCIVGARLQEGRQFLDSEPDVLFARYGVGLQDWTLVGTVGHYARSVQGAPVSDPGLIASDDSVLRGQFSQYINEFLGFLGSAGFADLPQDPGFSVVPLAVYRAIPRVADLPGAGPALEGAAEA